MEKNVVYVCRVCLVRSMSAVGQRETAALRQCVQARAQLDEAIAAVIKAEVQLKSNSREVRHTRCLALCVFSVM